MTTSDGSRDLLDAADAGDRRALARLLTAVERGGDAARRVGAVAHARSGSATVIGLTGAPGAGKSTLTAALLARIRKDRDRTGVLAIDPSSPFTGGAILGDRVRMGDHALDEGVFIRSMATRGHLGGLSAATPGAIRVLDAVGFDPVVVETVGVGQIEVEIAGAADTTVVVVNPGWGDAIQANKAGLLEIADVFVVNKADRPGLDDARRDLEHMLDLSPRTDWRPPIVETVATDGARVDELWEALGAHGEHLDEGDRRVTARRERADAEVRSLVVEELATRAALVCTGPRYDELVDGVVAAELDPWQAVDELTEPA